MFTLAKNKFVGRKEKSDAKDPKDKIGIFSVCATPPPPPYS